MQVGFFSFWKWIQESGHGEGTKESSHGASASRALLWATEAQSHGDFWETGQNMSQVFYPRGEEAGVLIHQHRFTRVKGLSWNSSPSVLLACPLHRRTMLWGQRNPSGRESHPLGTKSFQWGRQVLIVCGQAPKVPVTVSSVEMLELPWWAAEKKGPGSPGSYQSSTVKRCVTLDELLYLSHL